MDQLSPLSVAPAAALDGRQNQVRAWLGRLALVAAAGLACLGAWMSFRYARTIWGPDCDVYVPVEIWRGVRQSGLGFAASWNYTQDNWLLSLVPLDALLFEAFGPHPGLVAATGWLVFLASVGLSALLIRRLAGPHAAVAGGVVLLFANIAALGRVGYLAYPISHNVSMLWALGALALGARAVRRGGALSAVLAGLCVLVAAVSDPWAGPAIAAPLALAAGGVAAVHRKSPVARHAGLLALCALVGLAAGLTHLFGALAFLPNAKLEFATFDEMLVNARWLYVSLAAIFNIVPRAEPAAAPAALIDMAALLVVLGLATAALIGRLLRETPDKALTVAAAVLSILAVVGLFLVGRIASHGVDAGRFFPNVYFFAGVLIAAGAARLWPASPPWRRAALAAYPVLLVVAALASAPRYWATPTPLRGPEHAIALGAFLQSHGLSYGYGPFWGSEALLMETITEGRVTVRPVTFFGGRVARRSAETSSLWYAPGAEPATRRSFLIVMHDGEECRDVAACLAAAERQFGRPVERIPYAGGQVLVWSRPLVDRIVR